MLLYMFLCLCQCFCFFFVIAVAFFYEGVLVRSKVLRFSLAWWNVIVRVRKSDSIPLTLWVLIHLSRKNVWARNSKNLRILPFKLRGCSVAVALVRVVACKLVLVTSTGISLSWACNSTWYYATPPYHITIHTIFTLVSDASTLSKKSQQLLSSHIEHPVGRCPHNSSLVATLSTYFEYECHSIGHIIFIIWWLNSSFSRILHIHAYYPHTRTWNILNVYPLTFHIVVWIKHFVCTTNITKVAQVWCCYDADLQIHVPDVPAREWQRQVLHWAMGLYHAQADIQITHPFHPLHHHDLSFHIHQVLQRFDEVE